MGQLRFRVYDRDRLTDDGLSRIYVAGIDECPWATDAKWSGEILVVDRHVDGSGFVYVPWQVSQRGRYLLGTATLMQRERPYILDVELARGVLQRLRNRLWLWETLGLKPPAAISDGLRQATRLFAHAAVHQADLPTASRSANESLTLALQTADELVRAYAEQTAAARQSQTPVPTLLGVTLGAQAPPLAMRRQLVDACNLVQLPMAWRSIEMREGRRDFKAADEQLGWCQSAGLKVAAGPLLRMDDRGVPDWMYLWEGDDANLTQLLLDHVRSVVSRYAGRVHLWHVASRVNNGRLMSLDVGSRLNLVAEAVRAVRKYDARTPLVVSFDQPWGEYLADADDEPEPWRYADELARADLGISGFGVEINAGFWPRGSGRRPAFEFGRLVDQWSQLGLPLMVMLSTPSGATADPLAAKGIAAEPIETATADPQSTWLASVAPLLLARTSVHVVLWNQLSDAEPHEFPHAGLFDSQGAPKPALQMLRDLQKAYLS